MIKYRLLCFWAAATVAASSIGLAQTPPTQPAAVPAVTPPASSSASRGLKPAQPAKPKSVERSGASVESTSTQQSTDPATPAESPAQIAIIELPQGEKSEVIRQVVEMLEKQGIAKQVQAGVPTKTMRTDLSARIAATRDVKTEEVLSLVKSLQGHGIVRLSLAIPSDNRNVVTVQAPAETPWPVIDNIRTMVTAKKRFAVDVQIATPNQSPETVRGGSYNSGKIDRYGYSVSGPSVSKPAGSKPESSKTATSKNDIFRNKVNITGSSGKPLTWVEKNAAAIEAVLKRSDGIMLMMGTRNHLLSLFETSNVPRVAQTILEAVNGHDEIELWADVQYLVIRTRQKDLSNPDFDTGGVIAQELLKVLSNNSDVHLNTGGQIGQALLKAISVDAAANSEAAIPPGSSGQVGKEKTRPETQTRIFMLKYADAAVLAKSVAQLFDKTFGIVPDVRTNSVVVRGAPSQLREMEALVEMLDSQQPKRPVAQAFRPANPDEPLRQVIKPLNSIFAPADLPPATPKKTRPQVEQLERSAQAAAEALRRLKAEEAKEGANVPEDEDKRKAVLRDAVRQTFLARQNLQRAELAEFAARLNRIRQTIEMRDKIADKIIDRRVEELLDPNLKWDADTAAGSQKTVTRTQSLVRKQNEDKRLQPAPKQNSATVNRQAVVVTQSSDGTIILRKAEEFRKLLATHAQVVAEVQATIEAWQARREDSRNAAEADQVLKVQKETLTKAEANQKFAMKEYETQIQLLQSEVDTAYLVLETAKQELERASKLVKAAALPSHELDKRKREMLAAEQKAQKARILLDLYRDAGKGI